MAADGMQVATLDFCNQKPWAGRHVQNGQDMVALARHLGAERVVYAGFSAGGLAALLAGRADPRTVGILTLDLVDTQGLGVGAARRLDKPLLALAGEPTNCNAGANGAIVYAATDRARVARIDGAGHCDFEAPTDGLCELVCADPGGVGGSHRERIIASARSAASALLNGTAETWEAWAGGRTATPGPVARRLVEPQRDRSAVRSSTRSFPATGFATLHVRQRGAAKPASALR
jgi:pimeloyl-ACP methyl ester carboxylesterase